ncbi:NUDIX hydrolase domain-like protein [Plectosphaerella plurivora]|uniref:NUDIX hydrolase domain-like protein n=1 Tax=Plectosphaerella plurivora TaxID=936078 RepID=A0A9P8V3R0_9PEZI|nr:NUDIX hydrolase domain-like protein [Plectosphaerella plurivora]
MSSHQRTLVFSDQFVISCGTVTVDVQRSKVLLIRSRGSGECMLPKGRKDVGESLEETARRETFEETGVRVELLPVSIRTLATAAEATELPVPSTVTEPIAMNQRTTSEGVLKIIFWYVAVADSSGVQEEKTTHQENEDFDTIWTDFGDVPSVVSFKEDCRIAQAAIAAVLATCSS